MNPRWIEAGIVGLVMAALGGCGSDATTNDNDGKADKTAQASAKPSSKAATKPSPTASAAVATPAAAAVGNIVAKIKGKDVVRPVTGAVVGTDKGSKTTNITLVLGCPDVPNTCADLMPNGWSVDAGPLSNWVKSCPDYRIVNVNLSVPGFQEFPKVVAGPMKRSTEGPGTHAWASMSGPNPETDNAQLYADTLGELTAVSATEVSGKILADKDGNKIEGTFTAKVCALPPQ